MGEWSEVALGDLGTIVTGATPPKAKPEWFGDEVDFITPSDIESHGRRARPSRRLSLTGATELTNKMVPAEAVCFVCIASIGKLCLTAAPAVTNQQINTLVPNESADARFLYYLLRMERDRIASMASGAATPIINKSSYSRITVTIPDLETQRSIGNLLGAIDDLIEKSRRRVEVLEEVARTIYREWFVSFRFPGHEEVTFIDSALGPIPEDWCVAELGSLASLKGGSTTTKKEYVSEGYRAYSAAGLDGYLPDFELDSKGVVLSAVGARCGRTFRASGKWSSIANTIKILPTPARCGPAWLALSLEDPAIFPKRGSAQPFVSINDARGVGLVAPNTSVMEAFERIAGPAFELGAALLKGPLSGSELASTR